MRIKVLLMGAVSAVFLLLLAGCGEEPAWKDPEDAVAETIDAFFEAVADCDFETVLELADGEFEDLIEDVPANNDEESFCGDYRGVRHEIDEVDVEDDEAEVMVALELDGWRYLQEFGLEKYGGEWRITEVGVPEPAEDPLLAGLSEGEKAMRTVESVFEALRQLDAEALGELTTGEVRSEVLPGFVETVAALRDDPEAELGQRGRWRGLRWELVSMEMSASGETATVKAVVTLEWRASEWTLTLRRDLGRWLWAGVERRAER